MLNKLPKGTIWQTKQPGLAGERKALYCFTFVGIFLGAAECREAQTFVACWAPRVTNETRSFVGVYSGMCCVQVLP